MKPGANAVLINIVEAEIFEYFVKQMYKTCGIIDLNLLGCRLMLILSYIQTEAGNHQQ